MEQTITKKGFPIEVSSAFLHIIAMALMVCDHAWGTLLGNWLWLTCIGRIAFPIFAFMLVEGYFHTHNFKKYLGRMVIWALISEIPFDLMTERTWFYPFHQNVMVLFVMGLLCIHAMETVKKKKKLWLTVLVDIVVVLVGTLAGIVTMADYFGFGMMMIFTFYFFRERKWWCYLLQFLLMYWINVDVMGGRTYPMVILGFDVELVEQGFAMLALIPIWLYRGKQGYHSKAFQWFCYAFYPVHAMILYLIASFV